jgi:hypothetical protein
MAWVGTNSTNVTIGQGGAADLLWAIKSALLEAGWRLMSFGGGASSGVYQAPNVDGSTAVADGLTTAASLNVNGAWFRMKEPGSTTDGRELVFQRGDAATEVVIKYSKQSGFTGSNATYAVGEQYSPTTGGGDGQVVWSAAATSDGVTVLASNGAAGVASSGYVQVVAADEADANGVWTFYAWSYPSAGSRTGSYLFGIDGLLPGSHHPADADPCCLLRLDLASSSNGVIRYWHGYGRAGGSWESNGRVCYPGTHGSSSGYLYSLSYRRYAKVAPLSPYDSKASLIPVGYSIHTADEDPRWKGMSANIAKFDTNEVALRVFNASSASPKISLLSTYSATTNPHGLVVPWVSNKEPIS